MNPAARVLFSALASAAVLASSFAPSSAQKPPQTILAKPVEKKDAALDALLSPEARLEQVATGFGFTEGVTWVQSARSRLRLSIPTSLALNAMHATSAHQGHHRGSL